MADRQWLLLLRQLAREAAVESTEMPAFQMFGHHFSCIDGRCGVPVCGRWPYKQHRILAAHIDSRNARSIQRRLAHDATRAYRRGMRQLVICETHTDCAYRHLRHLSEEAVWQSCRKHCARLPNTVAVWLRRDVATGAITIVGEQGVVDAATLQGSVGVNGNGTRCEELLQGAGFHGVDLVHDLAQCLQGNLAYLQEPHRFDCHVEEGIVIGSGVPGAPTHFSISNRMEDLAEALGIATSVIGKRGVAEPFVAVAIAQNLGKPAKRGQYAAALDHLRHAVGVILTGLGLMDQYAFSALFSTKGSGDLVVIG